MLGKRLFARAGDLVGQWIARNGSRPDHVVGEAETDTDTDERAEVQVEIRPDERAAQHLLSWLVQRGVRLLANGRSRSWSPIEGVVLSVTATTWTQAEHEMSASGALILGAREGVFVDKTLAVNAIAAIDEAFATGRLTSVGVNDARYDILRRLRHVLASLADVTAMRARRFARVGSQRPLHTFPDHYDAPGAPVASPSPSAPPQESQEGAKTAPEGTGLLSHLATVETRKEGPFQIPIVFNPSSRRGRP